MNILVIGNGFDLAHNLPTRYCDFLNFIQIYQVFCNPDSPEIVDRYLGKINCKESFKEKIWNLLFNFKKDFPDKFIELNTVFDNSWITYFLSIYEQRNLEGKCNWIDFESEISIIIQELDAFYQSSLKYKNTIYPYVLFNEFQKEKLKNICDTNKKYYLKDIDDLKDTLVKDLKYLVRYLEIYLSYFIEKWTVNDTLIDIKKLNVNCILSFNYTMTFEKLYGKYRNEYDYIHGKADLSHNVDNSPLILGIDEYLDDGDKDTNVEFIQFKKYFQRIYKGSGSTYKNWLENHLKIVNDVINDVIFGNQKTQVYSIKNIYFYGHSLDITDKDIIKNLILTQGVKSYVFYMDQRDLNSKIINLVKIIGQDKLIEMTSEPDRKIVFKQITKNDEEVSD